MCLEYAIDVGRIANSDYCSDAMPFCTEIEVAAIEELDMDGTLMDFISG